jgi:hypothetical protein
MIPLRPVLRSPSTLVVDAFVLLIEVAMDPSGTHFFRMGEDSYVYVAHDPVVIKKGKLRAVGVLS